MKKQLLLMIAALIFMTSAASAQEYTMRPGDELNIVVVQESETDTGTNNKDQTPYVVRPDGKVSFPMAGEIDTTGMTVSEFTDELRDRLSRYIIDPNVSVNIAKLGTVRVYVFGEVSKPGVYELTKSHTVIDAIGAANGFTRDTAKKKIFLIHQDQPQSYIPINLNNILMTGDMHENYELREGDILYLKRNGRIDFARDIAPILSSAYMISEIKNNSD